MASKKKSERLPKIKKSFALEYLLEPLQSSPLYSTRRMFGGMAAYDQGKMVVVLMENADDAEWNGVLFPTDRPHHESMMKDFSDLVPHTILGKWLYLSMSCENFETAAQEIIERIVRRDSRFGILPGIKKRRKKK